MTYAEKMKLPRKGAKGAKDGRKEMKGNEKGLHVSLLERLGFFAQDIDGGILFAEMS